MVHSIYFNGGLYQKMPEDLQLTGKANRVFSSVQRYMTRVLKLVVNEQKSSVRLSRDCEYLGFAFTGRRVTITVAPKKLVTFKRRIKELSSRSRGISMERRLTNLNRYVRGWTGYFGLAQQFDYSTNWTGGWPSITCEYLEQLTKRCGPFGLVGNMHRSPKTVPRGHKSA